MAFNRFHEKAVALYAKKQAVIGTAETLAAANAIALIGVEVSEQDKTSEHEYSGDALSRDVFTDIEDTYYKLSGETFLPVTGGGASLAINDLVESCGVAIVGGTQWTNAAASNAVSTMEFRRSSIDIATEKTFGLTDANGMIDFEVEVGSRGMLKFEFMGNKLANPTQETALVADFGTQKTNISQVLRAANLVTASIGTVDVVGTGSNICFSKFSGQNIFGFGYDRTLTGCGEYFAKGAVANDFTVTVQEDSAANNFDAYAEKGKDFSFTLKYGLGAGYIVQLYLAKAQLVSVQPGKVGTNSGLELGFKNRSITEFTFT